MKFINSSDLQNWDPMRRKTNAQWHRTYFGDDNLNSKRYDKLPWNWLAKASFVKRLGYMPKFNEWRIKVGLNCSSNSAKPTETLKYNVLELAPVELHEKLTFLYKTKNIEMFWSYITSNNKQNETTTVPTISDPGSVAGC